MKKQKRSSKIFVDKERARKVLRSPYEAIVGRKQLFALIDPEKNAPQKMSFPKGVKKAGLKHRQWLYFSAMTDRREVSRYVYESHERLWKKEPRLYSEEVLNMPLEEITELVVAEKVGSPRQSAGYWPRSARTLFERFGGEPLAMYRVFNSVDRILDFKNNGEGNLLPGFGPKILSLLSLFYEELGLMKTPPDAFPVDVHIQRFGISTGFVVAKAPTINEEVERELRPLFCEICAEEGWSKIKLSYALWALGNFACTCCYRRKGMAYLCPAYDDCGGPIPSSSYSRKGFWDNKAPHYRKGGQFSLPSSAPLFLK